MELRRVGALHGRRGRLRKDLVALRQPALDAGADGKAGVRDELGPGQQRRAPRVRPGHHGEEPAGGPEAAALVRARGRRDLRGLERGEQPHRERRRGLHLPRLGQLRAAALRQQPEPARRHGGDLEPQGRQLRRGRVRHAAPLRQDGLELLPREAQGHGQPHGHPVDQGRHAARGRDGQRRGTLRRGARAGRGVERHPGRARRAPAHQRRGHHVGPDGGVPRLPAGPRAHLRDRARAPRRRDGDAVLHLPHRQLEHAADLRPPGAPHAAAAELRQLFDRGQRRQLARHPGAQLRGPPA
mmetsp:Transcript_23632/g.74267  ORF Transcript_23632/g.74267 Transcript_23632/m.74267 type:complete len:298 (-) Transcript_23632:1441-2334(-)